MTDDPNRNPDGTFKDGSAGNPEGGRARKGYQPYSKRLQHFEEKYTSDELIELSGDKKALGKMSVLDRAAIAQLAGAVMASDNKWRRKDREDTIDRLDGKASQPVEHSGEVKLVTTINV